MRVSLLAFTGALALTTIAFSASAQDDDAGAAEAKRQFQAGTQAYGARRFNEAALAFEAAAAYKANAVTLYTAALAWEQANAPERAADAYSRALDAQGLTPQQQGQARDRLTALEKTLGVLTVIGPEGFKVQLDSLTATTVPAHLHGTPGTHVLVARAPGGQVEKRDVSLELGQAVNVDVTPKEAPKVVAPPPPVEKVVVKEVEGPARLSWKKAAGFSALGLGVMAFGGAIVLGLSAQDAGDAYNASPTRAAYDHANGLATWSTVAWITGGVFVAGGVALVLLPEGKPSQKADEQPEGADKPPAPKNLEEPPKEPALSLVPTLGGAMLRGAF